MVLSAGTTTRVVRTTCRNALVTPFRAGEVGQSQRVFGDIGLKVVAAQAAVCESFLIGQVSREYSRSRRIVEPELTYSIASVD